MIPSYGEINFSLLFPPPLLNPSLFLTPTLVLSPSIFNSLKYNPLINHTQADQVLLSRAIKRGQRVGHTQYVSAVTRLVEGEWSDGCSITEIQACIPKGKHLSLTNEAGPRSHIVCDMKALQRPGTVILHYTDIKSQPWCFSVKSTQWKEAHFCGATLPGRSNAFISSYMHSTQTG